MLRFCVIVMALMGTGLSACAPSKLPLADVAVIRSLNGSGDGIDIYAARRKAGEDVPAMRGHQIVEIRSFLPEVNDFGNESTGQEVAGAKCEAILGDHRATVLTPGGIHVPLYGHITAPFSVNCQKPGFQPAVAVFHPFNKTIADRRAATAASGASGGLLGAVVATIVVEGINAASDETNDEFLYSDTPVLLHSGSPTQSPVQTEQIAAPETVIADAKPQIDTPVRANTPSQTPPVDTKRSRFDRDSSCSPWC